MAWKSMNGPSGNNTRPDKLLLNVIRHKNRQMIKNIMSMQDSQHNRLLGCMLGLAVGDVIGCPVEGLSFRDIRERYGEVKGLLFPDYWRHWRLPGLHSDDTQQALAILEAIRNSPQPRKSFLGGKKSEELEFAKTLASIYVDGVNNVTSPSTSFGCWRGTGRGFRSVVECLDHNRRAKGWPYNCGQPSAGLGAVMRIPPIGVLGDSVSGITERVLYVTYITHTDPLAIISASTIAYACHLLSKESPKSLKPDHFLARLHQEVEKLEQSPLELSEVPVDYQQEGQLVSLNSKLLRLVSELVKTSPDVAMRQIAERTREITHNNISPTGGFAPSGVAASLYFFLHNFDDPNRALLASINAGGDTDTIGAIVGALAGSLHGTRAYEAFLPDLVGLELIIETSQAAIDEQTEDKYNLVEEEEYLTTIEQGIRDLLQRLR
jgi:ADP-ribosylglycohydrolase